MANVTSGYTDRNNVYGQTAGLGNVHVFVRSLETIYNVGIRVDFTAATLTFNDTEPHSFVGFVDPTADNTYGDLIGAPVVPTAAWYAGIDFDQNNEEVKVIGSSYTSADEYVAGDRYTIMAFGSEVRYYRNYSLFKQPFYISPYALTVPCKLQLYVGEATSFTQIFLGGLNEIVSIYTAAQQTADNGGTLPAQETIRFDVFQDSPISQINFRGIVYSETMAIPTPLLLEDATELFTEGSDTILV